MLNVIMLNVVMLNVVMLSVIKLTVVAPLFSLQSQTSAIHIPHIPERRMIQKRFHSIMEFTVAQR
jgi:hypothetical protein